MTTIAGTYAATFNPAQPIQQFQFTQVGEFISGNIGGNAVTSSAWMTGSTNSGYTIIATLSDGNGYDLGKVLFTGAGELAGSFSFFVAPNNVVKQSGTFDAILT